MGPQRINRRQLLGFLGATGTGALALVACSGSDDDTASGASPSSGATTSTTAGGTSTSGRALTADAFAAAASCALTSEQTEGPFYVDVDLIRSDMSEDRDGTPLRVGTRVLDVDGCTPIKDAVVELWHCDADGTYSGVDGNDDAFLRGAQVTNGDGISEITTVYPGWYPGRTPHIHVKVFTSNREVLTSQLYFDDAQTDAVYAAAPYNARGERDTHNADDTIFSGDTVMTVSRDAAGYLGLINITVQA
jgi:protocatechuate 3,4-dioxygenase beta subunit